MARGAAAVARRPTGLIASVGSGATRRIRSTRDVRHRAVLARGEDAGQTDGEELPGCRVRRVALHQGRQGAADQGGGPVAQSREASHLPHGHPGAEQTGGAVLSGGGAPAERLHQVHGVCAEVLFGVEVRMAGVREPGRALRDNFAARHGAQAQARCFDAAPAQAMGAGVLSAG